MKNTIFDLLLNKSKSFKCQVSLLFFILKDNKLSSHIYQISEHINSSNNKVQYYYKMSKMIVHFGSKKGKNYDNSSPQITHLHNSLLMSIVDTPEKD